MTPHNAPGVSQATRTIYEPSGAANGEVMSENLRDRYAAAIVRAQNANASTYGWERVAADAVLAVRDDVLAAHQEQIETYYRASQEWLRIEAEQKAEIERWRGEYGKQHDRADRIQSNTAALYGRAHDAEARAHIAEAEVARLRETVGRVEALHHRRPHRFGDFVAFGQTEFPDLCDHCRRAWPCETAAALAPRPSASEAPRTRDGEVVDGYLCRHGKYAYEHDCDDHRDRAAGKGLGLCTCGTCLAIRAAREVQP